jgi:hypothetical protein
MRNLVASSIRRWRLPLAPNLASVGASEQIVATCYDAESRVTYAVTDACNLYGVRDSAREWRSTRKKTDRRTPTRNETTRSRPHSRPR